MCSVCAFYIYISHLAYYFYDTCLPQILKMTQNFLSTPCSSLLQELAVEIEAHRQTQLDEHSELNTRFKHLQFVLKK